MLSQQELSDRLEIQDLVFHYADLVDSRQLERLRSDVFTGDAHIDYSAMGGSVGNVDETLAFLKASLTEELFPASQHLNANVQVSVGGDSGTGRVMCFNPMVMAMPDGNRQTILMGLWYVDEYRRTPAGWRISRREEVKSWVFNAPDFMDL
ncbi:nuclear transport factor 2 family protein [Seongchinamella unica]|uniref:Nuclear transport factor 2 family protein n=1 Tax=Seongchinamella unica TaxID=2547392 RepID=A0A4R5LSI5_9GAMM|nr:nuclear transport factor 2 family protein [Seongchinamella unica]TDG13830.1 nuclear transport factor 2 family protein [Seongchinamella unica]